MKKVYITPAAEALNFVAETMLANSIIINSGEGSPEIDKEEDAWSNNSGGWSSENWSGE